ncbi:MAG: prephenate dehydratase [Paracoccaceae bacterium]|uniref:prephenate dehydratase n=1 Tax=Hyphomonas sp. TaxID=87 RepID=UPI0032699922
MDIAPIEDPDDQYLKNIGDNYDWVKCIHTLGPAGTNCEKAALKWASLKCGNAALSLHDTMEQAATQVVTCGCSVLLSVVAYPQLHSLIYEHISDLGMLDVFIMKTDDMVLTSVTGKMPTLCLTHPAPEKLLPPDMKRIYAASNAHAAEEVAAGRGDGCITTSAAAKKHGLQIVQAYGQVPMGFTIHGPLKHSGCRDATFELSGSTRKGVRPNDTARV